MNEILPGFSEQDASNLINAMLPNLSNQDLNDIFNQYMQGFSEEKIIRETINIPDVYGSHLMKQFGL